MAIRLSTPAAIVIGSVIIAGALYIAGTQPDTPVVSEPANVPGPATPSKEQKAEVVASAAAAFAEARDEWSAPCVDAETERGQYGLTLSFAADGTLKAWAVNEARGRSDPEVAQCLRRRPLTLEIPRAKRPSAVELQFQLPR